MVNAQGHAGGYCTRRVFPPALEILLLHGYKYARPELGPHKLHIFVTAKVAGAVDVGCVAS